MDFKNRIHFYPLMHVENFPKRNPVISTLETISQNCQWNLSTVFEASFHLEFCSIS